MEYPNDNAKKIWGEALLILKTQISEPNYRTWLDKTEGVLYEDGEFIVGTPSSFVAEHLQKNQKSLIERTLTPLTQPDIRAIFMEVGN